MARMIRRATLAALLVALCLLAGGAAAAKKKNAKECEVCQAMVKRFIDTAHERKVAIEKEPQLLAVVKDVCAEVKKNPEKRFCWYIGAAEDSATGLLREVTGPISRHLPPDAACQRIKKKDVQVCELEYEVEIDLNTIDLSAQRVKVLKEILMDKFSDPCKGCVEKEDFISRINAFRKGEL